MTTPPRRIAPLVPVSTQGGVSRGRSRAMRIPRLRDALQGERLPALPMQSGHRFEEGWSRRKFGPGKASRTRRQAPRKSLEAGSPSDIRRSFAAPISTCTTTAHGRLALPMTGATIRVHVLFVNTLERFFPADLYQLFTSSVGCRDLVFSRVGYRTPIGYTGDPANEPRPASRRSPRNRRPGGTCRLPPTPFTSYMTAIIRRPDRYRQ